ncbi:MAG: LysM peptidoglycan-binding domain-containing protein [Campylobacterota bacterium]|nr:LysM peptidoglycan-binding domain-containing protein [Campylobacterota bacterium]
MRKFYTLLFTLSFGAVSSHAVAKTVEHTIKSGETLYTIAHKNHTTIEEVRKINNIKKGDTLKLGRVLTVPQNTYFPDKKMVKHTIKSGETLFTIARKHSTSVEKVREANGLKLNDTLKVGRVLTVAQNTYFRTDELVKKSPKIVKHTIKSGETLFTIARKHGSSVKDVREQNGLKLNETLKLGRVLKVTKNSYSSIDAKKAKKSSKIVKHTIKRGETLFTIARKHGSSVKDVREKNGIKLNDTLKVGEVLSVQKNSYKSEKIKIAKKVKKIKKSKRSKRYVKKSKRKEQKLAKTLKRVKSTKIAKRETRKNKSFSFGDIFFSRSEKAQSKKITRLAKQKLGGKYVWGAIGQKNTFDCSGLTSYVCKKNGINIPRRAIAQSKHGKFVSRSDLRPGDLIFFDTSKRRKGYVNHVGIYLGNDRFIHASSAKKKVVITKLGKSFYSKRYKGARRVTS